MPASLFSDMDRNNSSALIEDQRALQLAFELSMLVPYNEGSAPATEQTGEILAPSFSDDSRSKKSQNMTECVPVPSSEHVAEIVGRQGCKIKALRAKTNTYIKTPVRGEEPVFVVTGRKEDVAKAKREILSAAEHFSQIRASRKNNLGGGTLVSGSAASPPGPPANVPGHVTTQVRVPYRVVGLVVGPKGATIKRIQHQTHTYIVTPSRDKEPVFEVTGLPESVNAARQEIEAHIAVRTGNGVMGPGSGSMGSLLSGSSMVEDSPEMVLASLYKSGLGSLFNYLEPSVVSSTTAPMADPLPAFPTSSSTGSSGAFSSASSTSSGSARGRMGDLVSIWNGSMDRDEGLGDSPSFEGSTPASSIWSFPAAAGSAARPSPAASVSPAESVGTARRDCLVCGDKEVDAALVPCGHNLFCLDCAKRLGDSETPASCPVCQLPVVQAIRIFS